MNPLTSRPLSTSSITRRAGSFPLAALAVTGLLPTLCRAQEAASDLDPAPVPWNAPWSPQGWHLCALVLVLAGLHVALERGCAWRLARRAAVGPSARPLAIPPPSASPVASTPLPPVS